MADITLRLVKGTELTFGELDANFLSLDSDITTLSARFDSFSVAAGLDSASAITLIQNTVDSAYVELMYSQIDIFRDSNFVENIVDSSFVNNRVDLTLLGAADSSTITSLIDSALDSVGPFYQTADHDSDTLVQVDSAYVRQRADSAYITGIIDSDYVKFRADSDYIKSAADSGYVTRIAQDVSGLDSAKVIRFLDSEARHIIPLDGETYDLGTNLKRWRNIYVKDLFVSPATIHFSDSAETPQSTLSLDSSGEFKVTSPTGVGFIAKSTTGNAFDSNTILSIIDSSYVQSRQTATGGGLDSAATLGLIDSAYIQARQVDIDTVRDSSFITSIIDASYVQARQVDVDTVRDSAFVSGIIDSAYVQGRVTFPADAVGIDSADAIALIDPRIVNGLATIDSDYVQSRVTLDGVGIDSATSIALTQTTVDSSYVQARVTFPTDEVGLDSTQTINLIDSAYVQARQVDLDTQRDSAFINNVIDDRIDSTQFLSNVVEDTTPQLGGNLDANSNNIQFGDSGKAQFGAGPDLEMYHDGTNSFINDVGDGSIFIRSGTTYFQNAAGTKTSFQTNSGGAQKFFYNNDLKIETVDSGAKVTGNLTVTGEVKSVGPQMVAWGRHKAYDTFDWDSAGSTDVLHYGGVFAGGDTRPIFDTGIKRISAGRYRYYLDSTNMDRITNGNSYQVFCTLDYNDDDPTASSRTLNVLLQDSDYFDLLLERADGGTNEDYGDPHSFINFQVWLF